jgi:hypothetical protein
MGRQQAIGIAARAARRTDSKQGMENEEMLSSVARNHADLVARSTEADDGGELRIGPVDYWQPAHLHPCPHNAIFEMHKDENYWQQLRRDISDTGTIIDPLLILPDGTVVSGHSRLRIATELLAEGRSEFAKIPTRVIRSPLTEKQIRDRVLLANLLRFEVDIDLRLLLFAEVYEEYFGTDRPRGVKTETVSVSEIAATIGVSDRQLRNERAVYREATAIAEARGDTAPKDADITESRRRQNRRRRQKAKSTGSVGASADSETILVEVVLDDPQPQSNANPPVSLVWEESCIRTSEGKVLITVNNTAIDALYAIHSFPFTVDEFGKRLHQFVESAIAENHR